MTGYFEPSGLTLISRIGPLTAKQATFDFQSISTGYRDLLISFMGRSDDVGNDFLELRFNGDAGLNYNFQTYDVGGAALAHVNNSTGLAQIRISTLIGAGTATAGDIVIARIHIPSYALTTFDKFLIADFGYDLSAIGGAANQFVGHCMGHWGNTAAINRVTLRINNAADQFLIGSTASLYGLI